MRGNHSGIEAIGHIVKDDWFCPRDDFADEVPNAGIHRAAEGRPVE